MPYMSETELQRLYREAEFDSARIASLETQIAELKAALKGILPQHVPGAPAAIPRTTPDAWRAAYAVLAKYA